MAHFALLDENNIVIGVYVVGDEFADTYAEWRATFGEKYVQTSYNTNHGVHKLGGTPLRKNYASIGGIYDETRDAFIPKKRFESWVLDETICDWVPPVPMPAYYEGGPDWRWDENTQSWIGV